MNAFRDSRLWFAVALVAAVLAVSACSVSKGGGEKSRYVPPSTAGGKACADQCGKARFHCVSYCSFSEKQCNQEMQAQAIRDYEQYMRDQFRSRAASELLPRDFERPEKCSTLSCAQDCEDDYRECYVNCGGKIEE